MDVARLAKWLSRLPGPQIHHLSLVYLSISGEEPVRSWVLAELSPELVRSERELTVEILEAAQEDCDGREAVSRYSLRAMNEADERHSAKVLKCRPSNSTDPEGIGDPSAAGIVANVLRHNEALMRVTVGSVSTILDAQQQIIAIQAKQIENLHIKDQAREDAAGSDDPDARAKSEAMIRLADVIAQEVVPRAARYIDMMPGMPPAPE